MQFDFKTYEGRQRFYQSTQWKKIKQYKKQLNPLCEICLKNNKLTPTEDIHHIHDLIDVPTYENATNIDTLQSLCKSCHSLITQKKREQKFIPVPFTMIKNPNLK